MRTLAILLFCTIAFGLQAQKLSKYYKTSKLENNMIYFIKPFDGFQGVKGNEEFIYDLTYQLGEDSLTMNYTYYSPLAMVADSLVFNFSNKSHSYKTHRLFIEKDKKDWRHRYTAQVPLEVIKEFYAVENAPVILVLGGDEKMSYDISKHKWRKFSDIMRQILNMISLNE
ncbi:MAG: hypothetical protein K9G58_01000 [Bacteroidales bacterium]|nr:hypothetical protein [Bacteroidales bacterium]MCF8396712.1 hypothetical protein [Bacteroidales bacterium]